MNKQNQSMQAIYLHQEIVNLKAMTECATHALNHPLRADSGKKLLIQVVARLSGLEEELELQAESAQSTPD